MRAFTVIYCGAISLASISLGEGSVFLRPHAAEESSEEARQRVVEGLLQELSRDSDPTALLQLEDELRPLFQALPKDAEGLLEAPTVRYALHRHFAHWRGWHMEGLELGARELNTTAAGVVEIFGRGQGTDLRKLALFVSKLTDLVHKEADVNLRNIYSGLGLSIDDMIIRRDAERGLQRYLARYLLGDNNTEDLNRDGMLEDDKELTWFYPAWQSVKMWSKDLDRTLQFIDHTRNPFLGEQVPYKHSLSTVQELGHQFATFQNLECKGLKSALMDIEFKGTGRVLLSDFYRVGLQEEWFFMESTDALRSLGALDDSDPKRLSVVIPNYLHSPTNCLRSSGFYSICCFNECEGLLRSLEKQVREPTAAPEDILEKVSLLESDTVAAPRNISSALQARLNEIAEMHGGRVPLHGRLFAQWMHHAYPRECLFPSVSGTTNTPSLDEWLGDMVATQEEMEWMSSNGEVLDHEAVSLPWIEIEELVAPVENSKLSTTAMSLRSAVALAAMVSLAFPFIYAKKGGGKEMDAATQRFLV